MLNKLLKRCVPWMDKGRWYHVQASTLGGISVSGHDNMLSVSVDGSALYISFNTEHVLSLVDYRLTTDFINADTSVITWFNALFTPIGLENNHLFVDLAGLEEFDCCVNIWLFMR